MIIINPFTFRKTVHRTGITDARLAAASETVRRANLLLQIIQPSAHLSFTVVNKRAFLLRTGMRKYRWNGLLNQKT